MTKNNIQDNFLMPEFTIDTIVTENGKEIPGIKRMYDIALAIKDSVMQWGAPGCLAGDTLIRGHWNGKTKYDNRKGVKIENIYKHQHGIGYLGSHQIKSTEFIVKSLNEKTGLIEETKVYSTFSGEKQCYLVTTENHTVEVTEEHPFLTQRGWVECKDLKEGDVLTIYPNTSKGLVRTSASSTVRNDDEVLFKAHPTGSKKVINGYTYFRKKKYIAEYEAAKNNMSLEEYIEARNSGKEDLYFVPKGFEVHHIDRNRNNNSSENVIVMSKAEHAKLHVQEDGIINPSKPVTEKLVSVVKTEVKKTYDLTCEANHNFFANGILVHNCGKSDSVRQWNQQKVEEYNRRIQAGEKVKPWNPEICDVRLSMKEPVDMMGVPIPTKNEKGVTETVWAIPSMWPKDTGEYSGGVIHLDEMNQGQASILNAAFQLIQDRALGDYKVPEGYIIIASSNPSAYNSTVTEFSVPLSNRFSHFNIKADFDSWLNYRMNNGGNLDVMTFLKTQDSGMLFDQKGMENKVGSLRDAMYTDIVVTPRSWEVVERLLNLPEGTKDTGGFTLDEKHKYATGRLGLSLATRLFTYLKDKTKYQDWHEILVDGKPFRDEASEQFWAVQMACMSTILNEKDDKKCRAYCLNMMKAVEALKSNPFKVMTLSQLLSSKRLKGRLDIFNVLKDAPNLLSLAAKAVND